MYVVLRQLRGRDCEEKVLDLQSASALFEQRLAEADPDEVLIFAMRDKGMDDILAFRTPSYFWKKESITF